MIQTQYILVCENDEYGEFYVGPFRTFAKAEAAWKRIESVGGTQAGIRALEKWSDQLPWIRQAEADLATQPNGGTVDATWGSMGHRSR